jgi:hypothetical protein
MRYIALIALALALAACGGSSLSSTSQATAPPSRASSTTAPTTAAPSPVYDDAVACAAFQSATTIGIPDDANAPAGETTLEWLQSQDGNADPTLQNLISNFVNAWNDPTDTTAINQAQAAVTSYCKSYQ